MNVPVEVERMGCASINGGGVQTSITCPTCCQSIQGANNLNCQMINCPSCNHEFSTGLEKEREPASSTWTPECKPPPVRQPPQPDRYVAREPSEWDENPNLWRRGIDPSGAMIKVIPPGMGLAVTGVAGIVIGISLLALLIFSMDNSSEAGVAFLFAASFRCLMSATVFFGSIGMIQLKRHNLARLAALLASVPGVSPCLLIGLPFGIWGMIALNDKEVKRVFS